MSDILSAIRKTTGHELLFGLIGFMAIVGPGFLTIYYFHPELVKDLDIGKLLLFSASLGAPVVCAVVFAVVILSSFWKTPTKREAMMIGSSGAALAMHIALLVAYLGHLNFRSYLGIIGAVVALVGIAGTFALQRRTASPHEDKG